MLPFYFAIAFSRVLVMSMASRNSECAPEKYNLAEGVSIVNLLSITSGGS